GDVFRVAQKFILPSGTKVSWQSAQVDTQDGPGLSWKIFATFDGVVIERTHPKIFISVKKVISQTTVTLGWSPKLEIHQLTLEPGQKWNLEFSEPQKTSAYELVGGTANLIRKLGKY